LVSIDVVVVGKLQSLFVNCWFISEGGMYVLDPYLKAQASGHSDDLDSTAVINLYTQLRKGCRLIAVNYSEPRLTVFDLAVHGTVKCPGKT
jgi:hypothetical protein